MRARPRHFQQTVHSSKTLFGVFGYHQRGVVNAQVAELDVENLWITHALLHGSSSIQKNVRKSPLCTGFVQFRPLPKKGLGPDGVSNILISVPRGGSRHRREPDWGFRCGWGFGSIWITRPGRLGMEPLFATRKRVELEIIVFGGSRFLILGSSWLPA